MTPELECARDRHYVDANTSQIILHNSSMRLFIITVLSFFNF